MAYGNELNRREPEESRKGGFRSVPFILVIESFEKISSYGLVANMVVYLTGQYHLSSVSSASLMFMWAAVLNFMPVVGACISDSYLGRFRVIVMGNITSLTGATLLFITARYKDFRPPPCDEGVGGCIGPNSGQMALIVLSFFLLGLGAGGVRPCCVTFGADQIDDPKNPNNMRALQRFFNTYYSASSMSMVIAISVMVYIQDRFGWVIGFAIPPGLLLLSTVIFLSGSSLYIKEKANRSLFISFAQVVTVAFKNKHLSLPPDDSDGWYHHSGSNFILPSDKLRCLNKACVIRNPEIDLNANGEAEDPWRLCTVEQVEELKALIKVLPIWSSGIIILVVINQVAFPVLQARTMDRHFITNNFEIPAGSYAAFGLACFTIWVAIYEKILVPLLAKYTKHKNGLTVKQKMGIGLLLSTAAVLVAGFVEQQRRGKAIEQGLMNNPLGIVNMSGDWLIPQYCLFGLAEAFHVVGQVEFYYSQFPKSMSSIGVSLYYFGATFGNLFASLIVSLVNYLTNREGDGHSWVSDNINMGHYDYYYFLLAGLSVINFLYYLLCIWFYGSSEDMHRSSDDDEDV